MDMNLQIKPKTDDSLVASYSCPCGCKPRLDYAKTDGHAQDGCCCGNEFAVGPDAEARLQAHDGFRQEVQAFQAPWGEPLQAAWTIGASVDPNATDHDHDHGAPTSAIDPVCGMTVERMAALAKELHLDHEGNDYYFCGRGCKLEFGDEPAKYLDPSYSPSM